MRNRVVSIVIIVLIALGIIFAVMPKSDAAPYCGPEYCVPSGTGPVTKGTPNTVYRVRFVTKQNGKVTNRFTAGPYFDTRKALRVADRLNSDDARNISRVRVDALSPGLRWEPAFR